MDQEIETNNNLSNNENKGNVSIESNASKSKNNSSHVSANNYRYICSDCSAKEPMAFYRDKSKIKLICFPCMLTKSNKFNNSEYMPLDKLKSFIDEKFSSLIFDWDTFVKFSKANVDKLNEDISNYSQINSSATINDLEEFFETMLEKIRDFKNNEMKKIKEEEDQVIRFSLDTQAKINELKILAEKCKDTLTSDSSEVIYINAAEILNSLDENSKGNEDLSSNSNIEAEFNVNNKVNINNFKTELINAKKALDMYKDKNSNIIKSYINNNKFINKGTNADILKSKKEMILAYDKLLASILKKNDNEMPIDNKNTNSNNNLNYSFNITDNYQNKIKNIHIASNKSSVKNYSVMDVDDNKNNFDNAEIQSEQNHYGTNGTNGTGSEFKLLSNNLSFQVDYFKNSNILTEPFKYLCSYSLSSKYNSIFNLNVVETSTGRVFEKNIFNKLKEFEKEVYPDSRYVNTGEGILICGGQDKNNKGECSKSCIFIQISFSDSKDDFEVLIHDISPLIEGRRRHAMMHFKSNIFSKDKKFKGVVLCLGGFKSVSCELLLLDDYSRTKLPDLNLSRSNASSFIMNDKVYIFGGFTVGSDKREIYLESAEVLSLYDLSSFNPAYDMDKNKKWGIINLPGNKIIAKCAYSVLKLDHSDKILICGGFQGSFYDYVYEVSINDNGSWETKLREEKLPENCLFLNCNFTLGEDKKQYSYTFGGKLIKCNGESFSTTNTFKFEMLNPKIIKS